MFMTITLRDLSFAHPRRPPLFTDLSLDVPTGRSVLLGPNGAGKSTLLALIADALRPRSGTITVGPVGSASTKGNRRRFRQTVSWLPQQSVAMPGLSVREHVAYSGWLKGLTRADAWDRAEGALSAVDLGTRADQRASTLSGGQMRRLGVASALVSGASWLLLDEPTAGLDPAQRNRFAQVVQGLPDHVSVLISTHQTDDVVATIEHVTVLVDGRVPFTGTVADFTRPFVGREPAAAVVAAYTQFADGED
ncbi:ABC transporter [Curtobacterium sp. MCPF17_046]|nr:ABC transporter [Curtobacterium sp. MCPF17_046]